MNTDEKLQQMKRRASLVEAIMAYGWNTRNAGWIADDIEPRLEEPVYRRTQPVLSVDKED